MNTAGEGRDIAGELPLDPASYKNSYKTPRHTDTHTQTGSFPGKAFFALIKIVQCDSPPTTVPLNTTSLIWVGYSNFPVLMGVATICS